MRSLLMVLVAALSLFALGYKPIIRNVRPDNQIQYLPTDELTGTTAYDSSGNGNNATYTRARLGKPGMTPYDSSIELGADTTALLTPYSEGLAEDFNSQSGTVSFWAKTDDWTSASVRVIFLMGFSTGEIVQITQVASPSAIGFRYKSTTQYMYLATNPTARRMFTDGNWVHFAVTWQQSGQIRFYVNGILAVPFSNVAVDDLVGTLTYMYVGRHSTANYYFDGNISNFAIWDTCLTKSEVRILGYDRAEKSILFFGDSWTEGYYATSDTLNFAYLTAKSLGMASINSGVGHTCLQSGSYSATYAGGYDRYQDDVIKYDPDYVVSVYGANDQRRCEVDYNADTFYVQYRKIIDSVKLFMPAKNIVIGNQWLSMDFEFIDCYTNDRRITYTEKIAQIASETGVMYADLYSAMVSADTNAIMYTDGAHPNDSGHLILSRAILERMYSTLSLDTIGISQFALYHTGTVDSVYVDGVLATSEEAGTDSVLVTPASPMMWRSAAYPIMLYYGGDSTTYNYKLTKNNSLGSLFFFFTGGK